MHDRRHGKIPPVSGGRRRTGGQIARDQLGTARVERRRKFVERVDWAGSRPSALELLKPRSGRGTEIKREEQRCVSLAACV